MDGLIERPTNFGVCQVMRVRSGVMSVERDGASRKRRRCHVVRVRSGIMSVRRDRASSSRRGFRGWMGICVHVRAVASLDVRRDELSYWLGGAVPYLRSTVADAMLRPTLRWTNASWKAGRHLHIIRTGRSPSAMSASTAKLPRD